ncbi:hypothetical protein F4604DRAFT_1918592 [Suillus subluteus]|nr:hypothetical protein F4604DRAFT_1918592 [Suillus subluteus]
MDQCCVAELGLHPLNSYPPEVAKVVNYLRRIPASVDVVSLHVGLDNIELVVHELNYWKPPLEGQCRLQELHNDEAQLATTIITSMRTVLDDGPDPEYSGHALDMLASDFEFAAAVMSLQKVVVNHVLAIIASYMQPEDEKERKAYIDPSHHSQDFGHDLLCDSDGDVDTKQPQNGSHDGDAGAPTTDEDNIFSMEIEKDDGSIIIAVKDHELLRV